MEELTFTNLAVVAAVAFTVPLVLGLAPALRLPAVVLELVVGIAIGPSGLGWVEVDTPVRVMALVGLSFLLLLAGLEIEFDRLRGSLLKLTGLGFLVSFALAIAVGFGLSAGGLLDGGSLLVAIILSATALGVIIPVLKDARLASSPFGQVVIAGASIADIATIVLLSLFFGESGGVGAQLILFGGFALLVVAIALTVIAAEHLSRVSRTLLRLMDTTAQIRVRGAFLLLAIFVLAADRLGLEAILGAFLAGAVLKLVDRDRGMTHPEFHHKLEAAGFGIFIPFFFVSSGLRFDLDALFASGSTIAMVPIFLAALLFVRGLPAVLYRSLVGPRQSLAAGLLQATSLSFIVVASQIGMELGVITEAVGAALIAAGLLSVLAFPLLALTLVREREPEPSAPAVAVDAR